MKNRFTKYWKNKSIRVLCCIILFSIMIYSCGKDDFGNYKSEAIIIGADYSMCACCGGWMITIDNSTYHFDELPSQSGIELENETFPITVRLTWEIDENVCGSPAIKWITVSKIEKK